jgi:hypothetical protein
VPDPGSIAVGSIRPSQVAGEGFLEEDIKVNVADDPSLRPGLCVLCEGQQDLPDMRPHHPTLPERILTLVASVLILKVTASVVSNYHDYFPANFASDFLRGRERYFLGVYQWAFYTHILSGPVSLVLGLILIGERSRARFPKWHRCLGRIQVACVLVLVTPSGLRMAYYARGGPIAAVGLAALAVATAICASLGAWSAVTRRFVDHRRWMWRCYLLLCSAVVLRLLGGLATVTGVTAPWVDPLATWMSWLAPLTAFELREWTRRKNWILRATSAARPSGTKARAYVGTLKSRQSLRSQ